MYSTLITFIYYFLLHSWNKYFTFFFFKQFSFFFVYLLLNYWQFFLKPWEVAFLSTIVLILLFFNFFFKKKIYLFFILHYNLIKNIIIGLLLSLFFLRLCYFTLNFSNYNLENIFFKNSIVSYYKLFFNSSVYVFDNYSKNVWCNSLFDLNNVLWLNMLSEFDKNYINDIYLTYFYNMVFNNFNFILYYNYSFLIILFMYFICIFFFYYTFEIFKKVYFLKQFQEFQIMMVLRHNLKFLKEIFYNFLKYMSIIFISLYILIVFKQNFLILGLLLELLNVLFLILIYKQNINEYCKWECFTKFWITIVISSLFYWSALVFFIGSCNSIYTLEIINISSSNIFFPFFYNLGFYFLFFSFIIKLGLFPGHFFWPEIFSGTTIINILFLGVFVKIVYFFLFLEIFLLNITLNLNFLLLFLIVGFFSLIWGSFLSFITLNVKKFIGFTSINVNGLLFILMSLSFHNYFLIFLITFLYLILYNYFNFKFIYNIWKNVSIFCYKNFSVDNNFFIKQDCDYTINNIKFITWLHKKNVVYYLLHLCGLPPFPLFFLKLFILFLVFSWNIYLYLLLFVFLTFSIYYYMNFIKNILILNTKFNIKLFKKKSSIINSFNIVLTNINKNLKNPL